MHKRGISAVVAVILIILIVIIAIIILWSSVIPLIKVQIESSRSCIEAHLFIDQTSGYTCTDLGKNMTSVRIKRSASDTVINEIQLLFISEGETVNTSVMAAPNPNGAKVYCFENMSYQPDLIRVAPIVSVGNTQEICDSTSMTKPKSCVLLPGCQASPPPGGLGCVSEGANCTGWIDGSCGTGVNIAKREQTRTCDAGCAFPTQQWVPDISCVSVTDLVAYWKFDGDMLDSSGNNNHGSCTDCPVLTNDRNGNPNSAYFFDGAGTPNFINISNSASIDINETITIAFWINATDTNSDDVIIAKGWYEGSMADPKYQYAIEIDGTNTEKYKFFYANDTPPSSCLLNLVPGLCGPFGSTIVANYSNWEHIAFIYNGTDIKQYINGVEVSSEPALENMVSRGNSIIIGADAAISQGFRGELDDLRIYNYSLSDAEILALFTG